MNLTKTTLLEAMKKCLPGVEKGSSLIEGADTFLFTGSHLHSYNDSVAVSVPVALDGMSGAVKALDFFRLVSKLNTPLIVAEATESKLNLVAGRTKAHIDFITTQTMDYIKELKLDGLDWKPIPSNFMEGVKLCKMSCNPTPLRGLFISGLLMASTDSARINHFVLSSEMDPVWLDDPTINEMVKLGDPLEYSCSGPWFHTRYKDGAMFSCKRKDHSQFPMVAVEENINAVVGVADEFVVHNRLPKALAEAVDRVSTMASGETVTSMLIRMTFKQDEVELYATKHHGDAEESVPMESPFAEDPNLVLWVESSFLLEASKKVMDFYVVRKPDELPALVFHTPNYTQLASTNDGM